MVNTALPIYRAFGFTLVELMVTISIVAILTTVAVPSFSEFLANQAVRATSSDLQLALLQARSESVKRNEKLKLLPAAGGWKSGWVIQNESGSEQYFEHGAVKAEISGPESVTFNRAGRVSTAVSTSFEISSNTTEDVRCIEIELSGKPSVIQEACS